MVRSRTEVMVLGTVIGTASGWDEIDTGTWMFYDFESLAESKAFTAAHIIVAFEAGTITGVDDKGKTLYTKTAEPVKWF